MDLPWPFSSRDLISYAFAIDNLEKDGSIIVVVKGVTSTLIPKHTWRNIFYKES